MVVIPKQQPVLENLNIYYLDVRKLLEHFQGEIGSGGIYFKSHAAEGVIFFDQDQLVSGFFQDKEVSISGNDAVERLLAAGHQYNFSVNIYQIGPEEVYFWAGIPSAEKIYEGLSTEFTDLDGLIRKMRSEKLTGYIDHALVIALRIGCHVHDNVNRKCIGIEPPYPMSAEINGLGTDRTRPQQDSCTD